VPEVAFGIAVMRGISAIGIGLLLFFIPYKSATILVNMMGFFWLLTGVALLRRSQDDPVIQMVGHSRTRIIAVVGVVAGLLVVTRGLTQQLVPEGAYIVLLGVVILLTGLVHLTANARSYGRAVSQEHRWLSILLGIFEIGLGLALIISPLDRSPLTYWIATIWALVFGVMVIGDAVLKRRQAKTAVEDEPSESSQAVS
jgi:uncharacterized membrane protein HdeD (DUF308 family)